MLAVDTAAVKFRDARLHPVWDKVRADERLSREDGQLLFETEDLHGLGRLANFAKAQRHGDQVFFVLNRYVNPTNLCVLSCAFCDFARKKGEALSIERRRTRATPDTTMP